MASPFWLDNPNILFNKKKIMHVWPQSKYSFTEKLNAITRLVFILTLLGYLFTRNVKILVTGVITIIIIIIRRNMWLHIISSINLNMCNNINIFY